MSISNKILIVDDELNMQTTLTDILEAVGYTISTASDGYQAIEVVKSQNFDVVLMDFKMPGMNGVEAFQEIRKIDSSLKAIFITAYYDERILNDITEGVVGVCNKPLNIPELLVYIKEAGCG